MPKPIVCFILAAGMVVAPGAGQAAPLDASTLNEISVRYRALIEAENRHDLAAVRQMMWQSPTPSLSQRQPHQMKATGPGSGVRMS